MSKTPITNYIFDPAARTITLPDFPFVSIERLGVITHAPTRTMLYQFNEPALGATVSGNVITLAYDTSNMSSSDRLRIDYDDGTDFGMLIATNPSLRTFRTQNGYTMIPNFYFDWYSYTIENANTEVDLIPAQYVPNFASWRVSLRGAWTGTIKFYISDNGSNWDPINLNVPSGQSQAMTNTVSANGTLAGPTYGYAYIRVTAKLTSGLVNADLGLSTGQYPIQSITATAVGLGGEGATATGNPVRIAGSDGTYVHTIRTDSNGVTVAKIQSGTGAGATIKRIVTGNSTNLQWVKQSTAILYQLDYINDTANAAYLKLYAKGSNPVLASDTPARIVKLLPNTTGSLDFTAIGLNFFNGLAVAVTGAIGDSDTTSAPAGININLSWA